VWRVGYTTSCYGETKEVKKKAFRSQVLAKKKKQNSDTNAMGISIKKEGGGKKRKKRLMSEKEFLLTETWDEVKRNRRPPPPQRTVPAAADPFLFPGSRSSTGRSFSSVSHHSFSISFFSFCFSDSRI
jgi:hypothetical protein